MLFLLFALTRPKYAFYGFLFLLPFLPRYLGIGVGEEGFALSVRRILAGMIAAVFVAYLLMRPNAISKIQRMIENRRVFSFMVVLTLIYAAKTISTIANSNVYNAFYVLDEILVTVMIFLMVLAFVNSDEDERKVFILISLGLFISAGASFAERIKGAPLFQGMYVADISFQHNPLLGRIRSDIYRCQALFDSPLMLSQFVCLSWPIAWYLRADRSKIVRLISMIGLIASPLVLAFTLSRSGFVVLLFSIAFIFIVFVYQKSGILSRMWITVLSITLILLIGIASYDIYENPGNYFVGRDQTVSSALARIQQYKLVYEALAQSPLIGWGMTRNSVTELNILNNLDSYWLRILIEGGILLLVLYTILFIKTISSGISLIRRLREQDDVRVAYAIEIAVFSLLMYLFFISTPTNMIYLYLLLGLLLRRGVEAGKSASIHAS